MAVAEQEDPRDVYSWNDGALPAVDVHDETLREGAQCPSARVPSLDERRALLRAMAALGVRSASIGFPAAGAREADECVALAREVARGSLAIELSGAARAVAADVAAVAAVGERAGVAVASAIFLGLSPIRRRVEGWEPARLRQMVALAFGEARRLGHEALFVAEDATRTEPAVLGDVVRCAVDAGARCVVIADTVGHATPEGARRIVQYVREEVLGGEGVRVEWHGHRDRGLAVANCLAAAAAGAERVHGTALGIGERAGNAETEVLVANLYLMGAFRGNVAAADAYVRLASAAYGVPVPAGHPVFGADAFRTATGVHAAAVAKAHSLGGAALADRVYSAVPAGAFGFAQDVGVSAASGAAAARWWLAARGFAADDRLVERLLAAAKGAGRALRDEELRAVCAAAGASSGSAAAGSGAGDAV